MLILLYVKLLIMENIGMRLANVKKAARKKQKVVVVKEIKMRPKIDEHDFQTKRNHIQRFIEKGDKVKVSIMFRGRERSHLEIGRTHLSRLTNEIEQLGAVVESPPRVDGANMVMLLAPKPKKVSKNYETKNKQWC